MLSFNEFILEAVISKDKSIKFATSNGIEAYITPHAKSQAKERGVSDDVLKELVTKSLEYSKQKPAEVGKSFEVLFYSKKLKQGIIASFRRDISGNAADKTKYFFIVTVLPPTNNRALTGTHKIVFNESIDDIQDVIALYESVNLIIPKNIVVLD